jgi:hypothetical protein
VSPDRTALILARQRALQCVRACYRDAAGRQPPRMSEQRADAEALFEAHREELLAWAGRDLRFTGTVTF